MGDLKNTGSCVLLSTNPITWIASQELMAHAHSLPFMYCSLAFSCYGAEVNTTHKGYNVYDLAVHRGSWLPLIWTGTAEFCSDSVGVVKDVCFIYFYCAVPAQPGFGEPDGGW